MKEHSFVESVPAEKIEGSEDREILLPIGPDKTMPFVGHAFLTGFSLPKFFFHVVIVYTLLRQGGVPLGEMDYLGTM